MVSDFGRHEGYEKDILDGLRAVGGDMLIHCGDICFGNQEQWHQELMNAASKFKRKVLIHGNHDSKTYNWYLDHGWGFVCEEMVMNLYNKNVIFTHGPIDMRSKGVYDFNVHGHLHGRGKDSHRHAGHLYNEEFHLDIAPELRGYMPVNIKSLIHPE